MQKNSKVLKMLIIEMKRNKAVRNDLAGIELINPLLVVYSLHNEKLRQLNKIINYLSQSILAILHKNNCTLCNPKLSKK